MTNQIQGEIVAEFTRTHVMGSGDYEEVFVPEPGQYALVKLDQ